MLATDEDALVCDFAEYYHIYDMQGLSPQYAAVLACGLREDSRIMLAMTGQRVDLRMQIWASIADSVKWLCWSKTKDGQKGRNRPASILGSLTEAKKENDIMTFTTAEEFERARQRVLGVIREDGN